MVQKSIYEDGVYKFICTFAKLDETFEELDINGKFVNTEKEEYYVSVEPVEDAASEEGNETAATRADGKLEEEVDGMKVTMQGERMEFTMPISYTPTAEFRHGISCSFEIPKEKNFYQVVNELDFSDFSLGDAKLLVHMKQTVTESNEIIIKGGWQAKNKRIKRWHPVRGKAFTVGPVVLVFFVTVDLDVTAVIDASATFSRYKKTETYYTIDAYNLTVVKDSKVIEDKDWTYPELSCTLSVGFKLSLNICLGIYGKILSIRVIPSFSATIGIDNVSTCDIGDQTVINLVQKPGPKITLSVKAKFGIYLDLSLKDLIMDGVNFIKNVDYVKLRELEEKAKKDCAAYEQLTGSDFNLQDENLTGGQNKDDSNDLGFSTEVDVYTKVFHFPWYPTINDNSFGVETIWDAEKEKMNFVARYRIDGEGVLQTLFFREICPVLCLFKDKELEEIIYPTDNSGCATKGESFYFALPQKDDNEAYNIAPAYVMKSKKNKLLGIDKSLPVVITSPNIKMMEVRPISSRKEYFHNPSKNRGYSFLWHLNFYTTVRAYGASNMSEFGVKETLNNWTNKYTLKPENEKKNGIYRLTWDAQYPTNEDEGYHDFFDLYTYYMIDQQVIDSEDHYVLYMNTDGNYQVTGPHEEATGTYASRYFNSFDDGDGISDSFSNTGINAGNRKWKLVLVDVEYIGM